MAYSMTGYGTAKANINGIDVEVQIKTLNHRNLDIHIAMGNMPGQLELLFQKLIRQFVGRGRVDVSVLIGEQSKSRGDLNMPLLEARTATLLALFNGSWSREKCMTFCLGQREIWDIDYTHKMTEAFFEKLLETTRVALEMLQKARRAEGFALEGYLLRALDDIDTSRSAALARAPERITDYKASLQERIKNLVGDSGKSLDDERLAMEVALLADKYDVTEELTRIATHLSALRILIQSKTDPLTCIGKKIDFYLQELNREATTMASKSRDSILTRHTIDIRTTIESIREQAANIQ